MRIPEQYNMLRNTFKHRILFVTRKDNESEDKSSIP
jgi:hypothetical protein